MYPTFSLFIYLFIFKKVGHSSIVVQLLYKSYVNNISLSTLAHHMDTPFFLLGIFIFLRHNFYIPSVFRRGVHGVGRGGFPPFLPLPRTPAGARNQTCTRTIYVVSVQGEGSAGWGDVGRFVRVFCF
jgi:hypothetical protein